MKTKLFQEKQQQEQNENQSICSKVTTEYRLNTHTYIY